jgi:hypothetical protein
MSDNDDLPVEAGRAAKGAPDDVLLPLLPPPALAQPLFSLGGGGRRRLSVSGRVARRLPHAPSCAVAVAFPPQPPVRGRVAVADPLPLAHPSYPTVAGAAFFLPPAPFCEIE